MKRCSKCDEEKSFSEFSIDRAQSSGYRPSCKQCQRAYQRANAEKISAQRKDYRENNRDRVSESKRTYNAKNRDRLLAKSRERHAANRDADNAKMRARRSANPELVRAEKAAEYERNKGHYKQRSREWHERNPGASAEYDRRRRARMRGTQVVPLSSQQIQQRFSVFDDRCVYCGTEGELTVDHIIPLSRGGRHILSNIKPACRSCNSKKRNRRPDEWAQIMSSNTRRAA